ncbi:MAG: ribonuclease HI [Bacteroidia bacterium]|jgi:ribonuclease HI
MNVIEVFTDGSSRGNPGPGGYGIIMRSGQHYKELSAGYKHTTNNRMELLGVIVALESIKIPGSVVVVTSDSKYVVDSVTKGWVFNWKNKNFKDKKNQDLWERFLEIYPKHRVQFKWIRGHNSHPENERCDQLAVEAACGKNLLDDLGYDGSE